MTKVIVIENGETTIHEEIFAWNLRRITQLLAGELGACGTEIHIMSQDILDDLALNDECVIDDDHIIRIERD